MSFAETKAVPTTSRSIHPERREAIEHYRSLRPVANRNILNSIVVPLDGTEFAEHAIPLAIALAKRSRAVVKLVRAFIPSESSTIYRGPGVFDAIEVTLRNDARRYLEQTRRRVAKRVHGVTVMTHLAEASSAIEAIGRLSKKADLVVMASRARGWLGRFFFGSVARDLMRVRKSPVIFVRGYDSPVDFSADPIPRHLTIGLDGRKSAESVLDVAGMVATIAAAKTTLVHIDEPNSCEERFAHSSPDAYIRSTGRAFTAMYPKVSTHVVRDAASPGSGLLDYVEESDGDLIAVTTRSAPSFWSTAEELVRVSRVPVLIVRE